MRIPIISSFVWIILNCSLIPYGCNGKLTAQGASDNVFDLSFEAELVYLFDEQSDDGWTEEGYFRGAGIQLNVGVLSWKGTRLGAFAGRYEQFNLSANGFGAFAETTLFQTPKRRALLLGMEVGQWYFAPGDMEGYQHTPKNLHLKPMVRFNTPVGKHDIRFGVGYQIHRYDLRRNNTWWLGWGGAAEGIERRTDRRLLATVSFLW